MIIYKITNIITGKSYIGQTRFSLEKRWNQHCKLRFHNKFHNAIRKYGADCWTKEIIEETQSLNKREIYWIAHYNTLKNGYNSAIGGLGSAGHTAIRSEEYCKNLSLRQIGIPKSIEQRKNQSLNHADFKGEKHPMYGKHHSQESKKKISLKKTGINHKESTKEKLRLYMNSNESLFHKEKMLKGRIGLKWYYNPNTCKETKIKENSLIPDGFVRGRLKTRKGK